MIPVQQHYLAEDAYHRGTLKYTKTVTLLNRIDLAQWVITGIGLLPLVIIYENSGFKHEDGLPESTILLLLTASAVLLAVGGVFWYVLDRITKRHRYRDFDYQMALHFMSELGHSDPEKILAQKPEYYTAFQNVTKAVNRELIAVGSKRHTRGSRVHETHSPAHRIASLVLRDERCLKQEHQLLALIREHHFTNYDQLIGTLVHQQ